MSMNEIDRTEQQQQNQVKKKEKKIRFFPLYARMYITKANMNISYLYYEGVCVFFLL